MRKKLKEKISESLTSVLPVTVIVLILSFTLTPMPNGTMLLFLLGAAMLILGMGFFSLGADMAMVPIGEQMGRRLGPGSRLPMVIVVCFLIGVFVTIAEPDLTVLAKQVPAVPDLVIILTVAVGVGVFLVASMLRTRFNIPLAPTLLVLYIGVFILSIFVPNEFLAVAFDSGGVTTGPITVPFIMALGTGIASIQGREEDNFGMVAMCSVGPILAVMVLGICFQSTDVAYTPFHIPTVLDSQDAGREFLNGLPAYMEEVALGLLPIVVFFALFQMISIRLKKRAVIKIIVGMVYTYIGLVLFLTGVNVGFMPAGYFLAAPWGRCLCTGSWCPSAWWWATSSWPPSRRSMCSTSRWRRLPAAPFPSGPSAWPCPSACPCPSAWPCCGCAWASPSTSCWCRAMPSP